MTGNLTVELADEETFFVPGFPLIQGATVELRDPVTHALVASASVDGSHTFNNLAAGTYLVEVTAPGHDPSASLAVVISGQTAFIQTFNALSPFDTVSSVTPLDLDFVADGETELRLHTVFDNGTSIADSTVDLRLDETLSTTVEAYKVEFLIDNVSASALTNFNFDFEVLDSAGNVIDMDFDLYFETLNPVDTVGTGLAAGQSGTVSLVLLGEALAGGQSYTVSGSYSYTHDGSSKTVQLLDRKIAVDERPALEIEVFAFQPVLGDDPTTPGVTEPTVPHKTILQITNTGTGTARALDLLLAQPTITNNPDNLPLISSLNGHKIDNGAVVPGLAPVIGDLAPGATVTVTLFAAANRLGAIDVLSTTFVNDPAFSSTGDLVPQTDGYATLEIVNDPRAGSDAFPDYLVNLNPLTAAPDLRLFTTDGSVPNFDTVASPVVSIIDGDPSDNVLQVEITSGDPIWLAQIATPIFGTARIARIERNDGSVIDPANFWQVFPSDDVDADYQLNILGGTSGLFTIFLINSLPQAITQSDVLTTPAGNPFGAVGAQQFANSDFFTDANGDPLSLSLVGGFPGTFTDLGNGQFEIGAVPAGGYTPGQSLVTISAGDGYGASNSSWLWTVVGDVTIEGSEKADVIGGPDFYRSTINGLAGDDRLTGNDYEDELNGGPGNDRLDGGPGVDTMTGGDDDDTYVVAQVGDLVVETPTGGALDTVYAYFDYTLPDNVEILVLRGTATSGTGNNGFNRIFGSPAGDDIAGLAGDDVLFAGGGADIVTGGPGNDRLDGGPGADTMKGGEDDDIYIVNDVNDVVTEAKSDGTDSIFSYVDYTASANVENLILRGSAHMATGNAEANSIAGTSGNDTLTGLAGNDKLFGKSGNDMLLGGDNADRLYGDRGQDTMIGGTGQDQFIFRETADTSNQIAFADLITDYSKAEFDKIVLTEIDADETNGAGTNEAFSFIGTGAFTAPGQVRYEQVGGDTHVFGNTDADLFPEFAIVLTGTITFVAGDFFL